MYSSMHVKALNLCVNYGIWLDRLNLILLWTRVLFVMGNCITHKSVISFCLCHLLKLVWCCVWFVLFHSSILNLFTSNFTLILNFYGGKKLLFLVCMIGKTDVHVQRYLWLLQVEFRFYLFLTVDTIYSLGGPLFVLLRYKSWCFQFSSSDDVAMKLWAWQE